MQSSTKSGNQSLTEMWLHEALFWAHFGIVAGAVLMGLVLPWQIAVGLIILHRIHVRMFDGCVFSRLQKKTGALDHSEDYLQQLTKRLFNYNLQSKHVKTLDRSIVTLSLAVIAAAHFGFSHMIIVAFVALVSVFGAVACLLMARSQRSPASSTTCQVDSRSACDDVKNSRFSSIFGIPVEYLGIGYFVALILVEIIQLNITNNLFTAFHILLLTAGLVTSVAFIVLQAKVLKTLCKSCLNVHGASLSVLLVQTTRLFS